MIQFDSPILQETYEETFNRFKTLFNGHAKNNPVYRMGGIEHGWLVRNKLIPYETAAAEADTLRADMVALAISIIQQWHSIGKPKHLLNLFERVCIAEAYRDLRIQPTKYLSGDSSLIAEAQRDVKDN